MQLSILRYSALDKFARSRHSRAFTCPPQKAQALLGQMLIEGYGCESDPEKGREWAEKARRRGYRMQGVYCEI